MLFPCCLLQYELRKAGEGVLLQVHFFLDLFFFLKVTKTANK